MAKKNKDAKPEVNDRMLEYLVTLTMLNERFRQFEKSDPAHFHNMAFEVYLNYANRIEPALKPYAGYETVNKEMINMENMFKRQVSKNYVNESSNMQRVCECVAEEYHKPKSEYGINSITSKEYTVKRKGSKYAIHQSFDEYKKLLGGRYELVTVLDKPTAKKAAIGNVLLDCEWVKIE